SIPTPSHAERAATLLASAPDGALSTLTSDPEGYPYGSLVLFGLLDHDPIFLVSGLAAHTRNLKADTRASLLVRESGPKNPLALGRVTLVGRCEPVTDPAPAREAFLAKNPAAKFYADFGDFGYWRLRPERIRYIGGFGRMSWPDLDDWRGADPDPIAPHAQGILTHMNDDHAEALRLYCEAFSQSGPVEAATMTGVDRYGFEMSAQTADGPRPIRVAYSQTIATPGEVRSELVALVVAAREKLGITRAG
ncbi:MAG: putative heme iron utilization protein, partial [Myxococcota bacterium]